MIVCFSDGTPLVVRSGRISFNLSGAQRAPLNLVLKQVVGQFNTAVQ